MVGKNQLQITANQFAQGLPTSDYLSDGGIGLNSQNVNPILTQGIIYATTASSSSGLSHNLVASSEDFENPNQTNRWAIDTSSHVYDISNGTTVTDRTNDAGSYLLGVSDMASYDKGDGTHAGALYVTSATDIGRLTGNISGGLSWTSTWWTVTKGKTALKNSVPHPLIIYQGFLWVGDGNQLHTIDTSNAIADITGILDFNEEITAFGIDPQTGLMMIAASTNTFSSGGVAQTPRKSYVYLYDGYSSKARNKIAVQGNIYSFTPYAGLIMVGIENTIGYWNGKGVTFLRRLSSVNSFAYKHRCAVVNNVFVVADGTQLLGYADILNGKKVWFPIYRNTANSNSIDIVFQQSNSQLGLSYDASAVKFIAPFDNSLGPGSGIFYTNFINFERPVFINRIRVVTTGITTTAGIGSVSFIDEKNVTRTPTANTFVVPAAASPKYVFDYDFGGLEVQTIQPKIVQDTQGFGIVKLIIYYTVAE